MGHEHRPEKEDVQIHNPELAELRLLTEVDNLLRNLDDQGNVSEIVRRDVGLNHMTALCEAAMPYAVTTTHHPVEYRLDERGRQKRVITWLGKTAIELAVDGMEYHFSEAAERRVAIETAEAKYAQETLRPGIAQIFISPKMSAKDATAEIAKAEHLHDDDSLRVSWAVTNSQGEVVARKMQSLLVRDIPLQAWVDMLKDPNNLFGQALDIGDEESALSVMGLFSELDIPEEKLPEGPVTLVESVLPYISNDLLRHKVKKQLKKFRVDQEEYRKQATQKAKEWFDFDLELARSLKEGEATPQIYSHIIMLQHQWNDEALEIIEQHSLGNGQYKITREFAAMLERSKRKLLEGRIAAVTNNEEALRNVTSSVKDQMRKQELKITELQHAGASPEQIQHLHIQQARLVATQEIKTGGGCAGNTKGTYGKTNERAIDTLNGVGELDSPFSDDAEENKADWNWKKGACQVKTCPSPNPTEVGPCSVCRRCQAEFDAGRDPTKMQIIASAKKSQVGAKILTLSFDKKEQNTNRLKSDTVRERVAA